MRILCFVLAALAATLIGFGFGSGYLPREGKRTVKLAEGIHPEKEMPLTAFKPFAILLYARNDAQWCERSLGSIFEQDYEQYRVMVIDDGSIDGTFDCISNYIIAQNQEVRTTVIRNESPLGLLASLHRAAESCLDHEILVPIEAKDWLTSPSVLSRWNLAFQNPDVWMAFGPSLRYPSYEFVEAANGGHCFYSGLLKTVNMDNEKYLPSLVELSEGRMKTIAELVSFCNDAKSRDSCKTPRQ